MQGLEFSGFYRVETGDLKQTLLQKSSFILTPVVSEIVLKMDKPNFDPEHLGACGSVRSPTSFPAFQMSFFQGHSHA